MKTPYVLSFSAQDKPGLVELLSNTVNGYGGNWLESAMSHLAGKFVGIIVVEIADDRSESLLKALRDLSDFGLYIAIDKHTSVEDKDSHTLDIELVGHDRPGIVRDISKVLAEYDVNVEDMSTELVSGSMSAETLFKADLHLRTSKDTDLDALQDAIEQIAENLMVDIHIE